ncbi:MAG: valine--tRNA ligase [Patescibacteria group bacterium]
MNDKFLKPYSPQDTEANIYTRWQESGFFNPDTLAALGAKMPTGGSVPRFTKPFTIVMPPPNANGNLHVGHALAIALEDIMIRYKRMQGFKTLWVPGADHAGFETQIVYEKKLEKEGRSRFKMDPQDLYKEILAFTLENKGNMEAQVRALGASCDWSREKFTLDPDVVAETHRTFQKMYDDGLVYRGSRIVNWCSKHATSLSDVETESKEKTDPFYYFKYGPFTIGTARPETKFGDKYVVMHPEDKRYAEYKQGQKIDLEWINGPITATVIKDEAIDMEFGTGVMTITPWHDAVDFGIAERHKLDREQVIDMRGKLLPIAGEFSGLKIAEARPKIVEKLRAKGLLVKVDEKYVHNVPVCYKCETAIEPQILPQWFVKMQPLAEKAIKAVEAGEVVFQPDNYRKIFLYWMNNTLDWNISRQIVWGIPIPAKICDACGFAAPDLEHKLTTCPSCKTATPLRIDTDTFDTWFSSGQWPLLSLGYSKGADWKSFYPTDVMETGSDLIFKWIPRMVIFGLYLTGKAPFHTVYLHGLVNDAQGKKMSKSKGNVTNPTDLIAKYGTDALRIGLIVGNTPGTNLALSEDKIRGYKNFANKLWNISRFVLESTSGQGATTAFAYDPVFSAWSEAEKALTAERDALVAEITKEMDDNKFYLVAEKLYHYIWHRFADVILEDSKTILGSAAPSAAPTTATPADKTSRAQFLLHTHRAILKTMHPFIPFVTEEIWSLLPKATGEQELLMVEKWPTA